MHEDEPTSGQGPPDGDETSLDRRKQAVELFQVAVDLPAKQRGRFLEEQCGSGAALRAELEPGRETHP